MMHDMGRNVKVFGMRSRRAQSDERTQNQRVDGTYARERVTNEHMNDPIPWYLPKSADFCKIDKDKFPRSNY